jgi:hypothetical protein
MMLEKPPFQDAVGKSFQHREEWATARMRLQVPAAAALADAGRLSRLLH